MINQTQVFSQKPGSEFCYECSQFGLVHVGEGFEPAPAVRTRVLIHNSEPVHFDSLPSGCSTPPQPASSLLTLLYCLLLYLPLPPFLRLKPHLKAGKQTQTDFYFMLCFPSPSIQLQLLELSLVYLIKYQVCLQHQFRFRYHFIQEVIWEYLQKFGIFMPSRHLNAN